MRKTHGLLPGFTLCLLLGLAPSACDKRQPQDGDADKADPKADPKPGPKADDKAGPKADDKAGDKADPKKAVLSESAPVDIAAILQKDEAAVHEILGEPTERGSDRKTCARFVPKLVRFECDVHSEYWIPGPAGLERLSVEFEDGKASAVGMVGLVGEGDFTPDKGLEFAGLSLPGEPFEQKPKPEVTVWDYFNPAARLIVDGKEHRVLVSIVDDEWRKSKIEVRLNHALTDDEEARVNFREE